MISNNEINGTIIMFVALIIISIVALTPITGTFGLILFITSILIALIGLAIHEKGKLNRERIIRFIFGTMIPFLFIYFVVFLPLHYIVKLSWVKSVSITIIIMIIYTFKFSDKFEDKMVAYFGEKHD